MKWVTIVLPLLLASLALTFDLVRVKGRSMEPSLCDGDLALVAARWVPTEGTSRSPLEKILVLTQPRSGELMLKRVVAVGGDRIRIEHGGLVRNEEPVVETYTCRADYFETWPYGSRPDAQENFTVPPGEVFVMGDNRTSSSDSRNFGSVPMTSVRGIVSIRLPTLHRRPDCSCSAGAQPGAARPKE